MENTMGEQANFFETLIQNCAVAVFAIDTQHRVIYWNKACERLTGIPAHEMTGTDRHWTAFYEHECSCLSDIIVDGDHEKSASQYDVFGKSVLLPNGLHASGWYPALGGSKKYIIFDASPVYNRHGELTAVVETLQDITERKHLEDEKALLVSELQEAYDRITKLRGLIPICSTCKKIRDAKGYWNKLEVYIEEHSEAEFTHSMCPACEDRFYLESAKIT